MATHVIKGQELHLLHAMSEKRDTVNLHSTSNVSRRRNGHSLYAARRSMNSIGRRPCVVCPSSTYSRKVTPIVRKVGVKTQATLLPVPVTVELASQAPVPSEPAEEANNEPTVALTHPVVAPPKTASPLRTTSTQANLTMSTTEAAKTNSTMLQESQIIGDGHQVSEKNSHIFCRGASNVVGKHCDHIYADGYNLHVQSGVQHIHISGSHALALNSGGIVSGVGIDDRSVKRIGKAQTESFKMHCHVDDRGIGHLLNPYEKDKGLSDLFRFPLAKATALVTLDFIAKSNAGVATGTATNTCIVTESGATEWPMPAFALQMHYNTLSASFEFEGVGVNKYSNSTSIVFSNSHGNGNVEVFCNCNVLFLAE